MPRFMDYHDDLKLLREAIDQIARETREGAADEFGVRQIELYHTPAARSTASWTARTRSRSASITRLCTSRAATCTR